MASDVTWYSWNSDREASGACLPCGKSACSLRTEVEGRFLVRLQRCRLVDPLLGSKSVPGPLLLSVIVSCQDGTHQI
jgi:hypothetical protein